MVSAFRSKERGATGEIQGFFAALRMTSKTAESPSGMVTRKTKASATAKTEADPYGMTTRKATATAAAKTTATAGVATLAAGYWGGLGAK